tara:strand:- start:844 stop:1230 length:387 start_codon:yes stop_codon:yes gene_type:complete
LNSLRSCYGYLNNIIKSGIKIDFSDPKKAARMAQKLLFLINSTAGNYCADIDNKSMTTINIETTYCDPVLSLEFSENGIHFIPLVDSTWQGAFFEVMRILYMWEGKKIAEEEEEAKSRADDEHDFEWI